MCRHRKRFIGPNEILLVRYQDNAGQYFSETMHTYELVTTALQAWREFSSDDIVQFVRMDLEDLNCEDVTEEIAKAYVDDAESRYETLDEDTLPIFVAQSDVFDMYKTDAEDMADTRTPQQLWGTHHTAQGRVA